MRKEIWVDGKLVEVMNTDFSTPRLKRNYEITRKYKSLKSKTMRTIYVKYWSPSEIGIPSEEVDIASIKKYCIRVYKFPNELQALEAYANTRCTYSTLLDEGIDIDAFIDNAINHILNNDYNWLEENFV